MTPEQFLDHVAAESAHFASEAAGSLDVSIDFLGWTGRELVAHLGGIYAYATANAAANPSTEPAVLGEEARAPEGDAINEWFAERRTTVLATLSSIDDSVEGWTHAGQQPAGWWKRRMAQETAVHRWDIDAAVNGVASATPIDSDLATDGIDEYLAGSLRFSSSRPDRVYPEQTLHLHRSDGPGEWMLATDDQGALVVTHEHGKGDAAVRGDASDLMLWIWGRPITNVEIFGDEAVAAAWQSLAP